MSSVGPEATQACGVLMAAIEIERFSSGSTCAAGAITASMSRPAALHQAAARGDHPQRILQRENLGEAGGNEFADAVAERGGRRDAEAHPQFRQRIGNRENGGLRKLGVA